MRALLFLLLLIVAPWASAQDYSGCTTNNLSALCPDEGTAVSQGYRLAELLRSNQQANTPPGVNRNWVTCGVVAYTTPTGQPGYPGTTFRFDVIETVTGGACGTNVVHRVTRYIMQNAPKCESRPPVTGGFTPPNGSLRCSSGCEVVYYFNGDGTSTAYPTGEICAHQPECGVGYYWHPTLNVCAPVKPEDCDSGVTPEEGVCNKPEECPSGMHTDENGLCKPDANECPAGKTKGPDGSCTGDDGSCGAGKAKGNDGTCKPDSDNDGTPDDEDDDPSNDPEKNEFSGGDDCSTPPTCSGDPILCGQARIQWRIDCNTRRNTNITGGACDAVPVCTGEKCNAMEYAQLLQQWRSSCALQKLASTVGEGGINVVNGGGGGGGSGDGDGNGIPDDAEGGVDEESGPEPSVGEIDGGALWSKVDRSGWLGGGGSCPGLPQFDFKGKTYNLSTKPCEQVALLGNLIVAAAMAAAAYIIGRAAAGG